MDNENSRPGPTPEQIASAELAEREAEARRKARHSMSVSKWRSSHTKTKSIVFDLRKVRDKALYDYIKDQENGTAFVKDAVEAFIEKKSPEYLRPIKDSVDKDEWLR